MSEIEFSRPVRVEPLPRDGLIETLEATPEERAALARLNGLSDIARLIARFRVSKWKRGVRVEGEVSARVTQTCVVSLEPFEVDIEEPVEARFLPHGAKKPAPESGVDEFVDPDVPDEIVDGRVDLGKLASEFLTLALDPYPRKPGAAFAPPADADDEGSAFSGLKPTSGREEPD
jgi:uncharacterized metal-binding protein YceD (DUF177 family)